MAVLSKHGIELFRIDDLTCRISFRSDGQIMRDNGSGWKLWKRLKAGVDAAEYADRHRAKWEAADKAQPFYCAFRDLLAELVPFKARHWVCVGLQTLPDDPDGLCVELQESGLRYSEADPDLSLDDCCKLCEAYRLMQREREERLAAAR